MDNLFKVLQIPSKEILHMHSISYFDNIIEKYPDEYQKIVAYINECYNYHSEFLLEEKEWGHFLMERFRANDISEELRSSVIGLESPEIVFGIGSYIAHQKEPIWATLVAKQNLRMSALSTMQSFGGSWSDKQKANELVSGLDVEINDTFEKLRNSQKVFGNFKGIDAVKAAVNKFVINIANWI